MPAPALGAAIVTEHGTLQAPATGLTAGPDGALWHTSAGDVPRLGRTTLAGRTVEVALPDAEAQPGAIVRGPDGLLWLADAHGAIDRVSATGAVETVTEVPSGAPTSLAAGADGNVWFTVIAKRGKSSGAIGRVTPAGDQTLFTAGLTDDPHDIGLGWDGAMWFTEPGGDRIGRVTAAGAITEFPAAGGPTGIAAAFDGAMWFTTRKDGIGRIALDGTVTGYPAPTQLDDIALGADAALWFTGHNGIGRITTAGLNEFFKTPDRRPGSLAVGWDGAMWFTDAKHPALGRISLTDAAAAVAPPVIGKTFVAGPASGRVRVKTPGADDFIPVTARTSVPVGSLIDARHGEVRVRSAVDRRGTTQVGMFSAGRFKVRQSRSDNGLVRIALRGRLDCKSRPELATAARRRRRRRVWSSDGGGLFATLGLDSVTTVRGTRWLTEDRCGGTLTRVVRGSVVVRERATGRRFVLHAGERHFARHQP